MTAEEKLKEWYKMCEPSGGLYREGLVIRVAEGYGVDIAPEHIDLIVNLVVERLKGDK